MFVFASATFLWPLFLFVFCVIFLEASSRARLTAVLTLDDSGK